MTNFICKKAQVVLFLFCLKQTHTEGEKYSSIKPAHPQPKQDDNKDGFYALVQNIDAEYRNLNSLDHRCGAVWISDSCLLTAASCLDKNGTINLLKAENFLIKVKVQQTEPSPRGIVWQMPYSDKMIGVAIVHPLYKRVERANRMTIGYDLAVIRVNFVKNVSPEKVHKIGTLCKEDKQNSKLIALALEVHTVTEWELKKNKEKQIALVDNHAYVTLRNFNPHEGEEYYIDPRKQFTTNIDISEPFEAESKDGYFSQKIYTTQGFGGPVLDTNNGRCIYGIMNFGAFKKGKYYITSTKVTPVIKWIEYTKNYLRNVTGQDNLTKRYGKAGMKYWKLRGANPDPIGTDTLDGETPGEPVEKKEKVKQTNQKHL